jgi:hypothetical protein
MHPGLECVSLRLHDKGYVVQAYTWKTDRHRRMRFDVWTTDGGCVMSNADMHEVLGFLTAEMLDALRAVKPTSCEGDADA